MKKALVVLKFELDNYFKSKTYIISTLILCLISAGLMFLPRILSIFNSDDSVADSSSMVIEETVDGAMEDGSDEGASDENLVVYGFSGPKDLLDEKLLAGFYPGAKLVFYDSEEELKADIEEEEGCDGGFAVKSAEEYTYYVYNSSLYDNTANSFAEYLRTKSKVDFCEANGIDSTKLLELDYQYIQVNEEVLGKDSANNYWYCYFLVIIVFMLIIMYGMQVASSVTNEKSNRSIEILVTSTSSTAILVGKVFAGVISSFFQSFAIGITLFISYQVNKDFFGGMLGALLNIPSGVILTFAVFGIGGFILYAFLYAAMGALVSKIEDLNKTAGTAQMLVMLVYFAVLFNLSNVDGIVIKVCSFLPISSYSAMFARVAMGNVSTWEVVVSAILLYASAAAMGVVGGRIFRNSTLRYGQPIKLGAAFKAAFAKKK